MEFFDGFWIQLVLKVAVGLLVILTGALVVIYAEVKIGGHMQTRIGPYYAGGRWGWAQPLADAAKFLQKEDLAPDGADRKVYGFAPYVVMMSALAVFAVIPMGPDLVGADGSLVDEDLVNIADPGVVVSLEPMSTDGDGR